MKTFYVGFSHPHKWKPFAKAIMWADKSDVSHSFLEFDSKSWGVGFIYQNSGHQTNFMGSTYFNTVNQTVERYAIEVPEAVEARIGKLCVDREGAPYAVMQVIGKMWVYAVFLLSGGRKAIKNPVKGSAYSTDCIEEVSVILAQGLGLQTPLDMNSVTVTPFRKWIASLPNVKLVEASDPAGAVK